MGSRDKTDYARMFQEKAVIEKRQMAIERRAGSPARSSSPGRSASPGRGSTSGLAAGVPGGGKPAGAQVRVITLNHGEHQDSTLYRLEKGDYLQFCPGPSLLGRKVFLYTNYVVSDDPEQAGSAEFVRNQYYQLSWWRGDAEDWAAPASSLGSGLMVTDTDMYCELRLMRGGAFHFYWVYESSDGALGPAGSGWWHVAPTLRVGAGGRERVPLDGITCQTVLTKCLGPLPRWEQTLKVARESGYNMVHFTPVQELGRSDSSYSIANQLRLDPRYGPDATFADVENLVTKMRTEWKMLSICDVVLNHTANETPWLREHPSATYNCEHVARLRPAALLDAVLARLTDDVARGGLDHRGVPANVNAESHLEAIRHLLSTQLIPELRLHEMYICNVSEIVQEFYYIARNKVPPVQGASKTSSEGDNPVEAKALKLIQDPQYRRLKTRVDMDLALQIYNIYWPDCYDEESRLKRCAEELKRKLDELNRAAQDEVEGHLRAAVDNCVAGMRYFRIQGDGPKIEEVSVKNPLVPRYFTWPEGALSSTAEAEIVVFGPQGAFVQAHNGWVMGADPLQDFAAEGNVYLRRELIAWGDSVKLRYGSRPEDSPFLWQHMREYVELTAEVFDGIRLDNCHSTPLPVAEYLIDCARNVKPDLYVAAELFTNSDQVDNIFVNRLGITSLIREAMSAWDSHELGRLVHRFGGRPVGAFLPRPRRAAMPQVAHALFLDLTHDNPSPVDKRSVYDLLPSAALVAMASCASGSTRGYDELVPHHIHVVDEGRQYSAWGEGVAPDTGLVTARRALNALHLRLAREGYDQVYVDQMDADIVAVTRHEPRARRSIILVSFTAFSPPQSNARRRPAPLRFEGELDEVLLEAALVNKSDGSTYVKHAQYINGLPQYGVQLQQNIQLAQSQVFSSQRREGEYTVLEFRDLAPGQIVVVKVSLRDEAASALSRLQRVTDLTSVESPPGLAPLLGELDLSALNVVLYRCEAEERDSGGGLYDVPGYGPLLYAGLQGVASVLSEIAPADDLGHPLCANLRAGDWLPDYMWQRLEAQRLQPLASWLREALAPLRDIPRYLHPAYFEAIVFRVHHAAAAHATRRCSDFVKQGCSFTRALALTSVQLVGAVPSASLPPPSPALPAPRPRPAPFCDTMSAGLPHFTTGYMRVWGRDTFVALRGLLLLTGRHDEARWHILGFGACLRHGLIPNLLDQGTRARFNCRDAVWWWLHAIRQYCELVPGGASILQDPVSRLFPRDDAAPAPPGAADQPLHRTIQEALDTHFQGLVFRERNAGRTIDAHMTDKGFNVQIGIDPDTGFPFGGNDANCGTWMDKMGSSEPAGTRGKPATPRDGSAIELVALAYSVAQWLTGEHAAGRYPVAGMTRAHRDGTVSAWTWSQWADRIHRNFERHFWVGPPGAAAESRPDLVHRRNIYKDSVGASQPWADYQLRSNYLVAMSVAPELFEPSHAWAALETAQRLLVAPLGVKTLDPDDWAYSPDYDNSNNSTDPKVAHGYNYHQGPEWLWPLGFYLTARLHFAQEAGCYVRTVGQVRAALGPLQQALNTDPWRGLPELTNSGGKYCPDSCRSQAWSSATILEVLYELERWERARPLPASD